MPLSDQTYQRLLRPLQWGLIVGLGWTVGAIRLAMWDAEGPNQLKVPVRIEQDVEAHLYYDVGQGLWGGHVEIQHWEGQSEWRVRSFPLPRQPIQGLRFDPMLKPGEFAVGAPWLESRTGRVIARFPKSAVVPRHQIKDWRETVDGFEAITFENADDAQVQFGLGWPLRGGSPRWPWIEALVLVGWIVGLTGVQRHRSNLGRVTWRGLGLAALRTLAAAIQTAPGAVWAALQGNSCRMVWAGAVVVLVGQLWVLRGLEDTLDLPMWDESNYAARGVDWARDGGGLGDLHTGPAFVVVYGIMSWWGAAEDIVYWQHFWVKAAGTVGLYLLLVKWWQRWPAAMAVALAWGCTTFQSEYPLLVYQSAWMWFLLAVLVIERWALLGLLLMGWVIGFRQDYQFALPVAVGAVAWRWWRAGTNGKNLWSRGGGVKERRVVKVLVLLGVMVLGWFGTQVTLGGIGARGWFAFQQHYTVRAVTVAEVVGINPLADYPKVIARDFPGATSLSEAWAINRPAVVRHLRWNLRQALMELVKLWKPQGPLLVAFMALIAAGVIALLLDAQARGHGERMGSAGWVGIVLAGGAGLVVGPGLVVLAKGPYLLPLVPITLFGVGVLVRAIGQRLPIMDQINGAMVAGGLLALGVVLLGCGQPVFKADDQSRPVAMRLNALRKIWPKEGRPTLVGYGASTYSNYLGSDRCRWVEPINAVTGDSAPDRSVAELVADETPFAVLVTQDWRNSNEVDDAFLADLVTSKGWAVREVFDGQLYWNAAAGR